MPDPDKKVEENLEVCRWPAQEERVVGLGNITPKETQWNEIAHILFAVGTERNLRDYFLDKENQALALGKERSTNCIVGRVQLNFRAHRFSVARAWMSNGSKTAFQIGGSENWNKLDNNKLFSISKKGNGRAVPLKVRAGSHVGNLLHDTMKDRSLILEGKKLYQAHRREKPEWVTNFPSVWPRYFRIPKVCLPAWCVDAAGRRQARDDTRR